MSITKKCVYAMLLIALLMTTTTSCDYVKKQIEKLEEAEKPAHTDSVTITAYSKEVTVGEKPDFMEGAEATDSVGKVALTVDTSQVNLNVDGDYPVTYSATGKDGYVTTKTVRLKVTDPNKRIIYLTFDDGPSSNTAKILDILKENNVHATFFVTAQNPGCFNYIKRAHDEGNAVAAHTYSHNFNIYRNFDAYFADMDKIQNVIEKYTGQKSKIIRFPGGSSNTMFRRYSSDPEFMLKLTQEVLRRGYQYVDWNADSRDASTCFPSEALVARSACHTYGTQLCLLMHDTQAKNGTVAALPTIIKYFRDNGYEFRTITSTGYVCHHGIRGMKARSTSTQIRDQRNVATVKTAKGAATDATTSATKSADVKQETQTTEAPAEKPVVKPTEEKTVKHHKDSV